MKQQLIRHLRPVLALVLGAFSLSGAAQQPAARLAGPISAAAQTVLAGSKNPRIAAATDLGALPGSTALNGMTMVLNRSAAQETALQALIAAQQTPGSPQFHRWLTPAQFAAQFGVADSDLSAIESWLGTEGFTVNRVASSRNRIIFSGTAAEVNAAFGAALHRYQTPDGVHFAPSGEISVPVALAPLVTTVENLSDFRLKPSVKLRPQYTSSQTQAHYLDPLDVATQYDATSVYNSGINGAGQTIAIAGQSFVNISDIQNFQKAAGLPANLPSFVLVPNSGVSAIYEGDEAESDIDLEYSSGMGRGANILFVYTGDSYTYGVFNAWEYAITEDLAPIVSLSYGDCEPDFTSADVSGYTQLGEQANSQGQTLLASAGDDGSTACALDTNLSVLQQQSPAVGVPSDLASVTAMGGLQMAAGTYATGDTQYFSAATSGDNISSLLSYVPEVVWNEDSATYGLSAGGGGGSILIARPSWQAGVPGIPAGSFRLEPDLALQASVNSPGYLFCSSDPSAWGTGQTSSCTNGFRDSSSSLLTVAGGTSFSSPIFAGLLSVLNQATHSAGQGNINPTLYALASNSATYASAFHDIVSGGNQCTAGPTFCSTAGEAVYAAGTGYDEASGLGSIDFANLVKAWPATAATALQPSTTTLTAATLTPAASATDVITITVAAGSGTGTPTGTVNVSVDGGLASQTLTLVNGVATYTYPGIATGGSHVVVASYSGDGTYAPSTGSVSLTTAGTSTATGSFTFTVAPLALTAASGEEGTTTITVTPTGGYTGSINFSLTGLPSTACYGYGPAGTTTYPSDGITVSGTTPVTLIVADSTAVCGTSAFRSGTGAARIAPGAKAANGSGPRTPWSGKPVVSVLAGLLAAGLLTRRKARRLPVLLGLALLTMVAGLGLSGCGGSTAPVGGAGTTPTSPTTYTVTVVGTDSVTAANTYSSTFTLTVN